MSLKISKNLILIGILILLKISILVVTFRYLLFKKQNNYNNDDYIKQSYTQNNIEQEKLNEIPTNMQIINENELNSIPIGKEIKSIGQHINLSPTNEKTDTSLIFDDPKNILNFSISETFLDDINMIGICSRDPTIK